MATKVSILGKASTSSILPNPSSFYVLVVDDEPEVRDVLVRVVASFGYRASGASGGTDALLKLESESYDLVITDLAMPDMSGWNLLREVKRLYNYIPVVVITGFVPENSEEMLSSAQADGYLVKPIDGTDLNILLKALLYSQNLGRQAVVVVVDDEADAIEAMQTSLTRRGLHCVPFTDAGKAIERILREPPDMVVLDYMLRGLTGFDVAARMRNSATSRQIPILMITSAPTTEVVQRAVELKINGFVAQSFDPRAFGDKAIQILKQAPV
jgi:CheY-like chemotaxis protein